MDGLSVNLQAATKGSQEVVPIVKVHHIIMALGNISKGFPDYPQPPPSGYILPPLDVFAQVAQAILVCLEAMNAIKIVRDAVSHLILGPAILDIHFSQQTRFAFARILASAGPSVTHFIPPLMSNLLAHFEPSELVDFMNFIGLLIRKLQVCMLSKTYHLSLNSMSSEGHV
jgi:exportin-T